jgi:hypothetical protein
MCSLQEAFQSMTDGAAAPAESVMPRRKKKRSGLPPPEPLVVDPDRPSFRRAAAAAGELLGGPPPTPSAMLNAYDYDTSAAAYFPNPSNDVDTKDAFLLEPDWTKVFHDTSPPDWIKARMPSRAAEVPLEPAAWLDGSATLWANVPAPAAAKAAPSAAVGADRLDTMQQRLDTMFKKLEDMEVSRGESNLLEILLFVLGGVFLLLLVDMMVKQGMRATLMLAGSGGGAAALTQLIGGRI